jgi:ribosomal protein L35
LTGRSQKRKRQARNSKYIGPSQQHQIEAMLPYGGGI